jgi:hypothetical protein
MCRPPSHTPKSTRCHADTTSEGATESVPTLESYRSRDDVHAIARRQQTKTGFTETCVFDEGCWGHAKNCLEQATEMARTKTGSLGQDFYGKICAEVSRNPTRQLTQAIRWFRFVFRRQEDSIIITGWAQMGNKIPGDVKRDLSAIILFDERQSHLDGRRSPSAAVERTIL